MAYKIGTKENGKWAYEEVETYSELMNTVYRAVLLNEKVTIQKVTRIKLKGEK